MPGKQLEAVFIREFCVIGGLIFSRFQSEFAIGLQAWKVQRWAACTLPMVGS